MITAIVQARMSSTRLPGKVLLNILDKPMIFHLIDRLERAQLIDHIILATSDHTTDDPLAVTCQARNIACFRGSLDDVLNRYIAAAAPYQPDHVVRITGDCPLMDPQVVDAVIQTHLSQQNDYTSNIHPPTLPDGMDVEIMTYRTLLKTGINATRPYEKEHVTPYIYEHPTEFQIGNVAHPEDLSHYRLTVDEPVDFDVISAIFEALSPINPHFALTDIIAQIKEQPELYDLNAHIPRNAGLKKEIAS